MKSITIIIVLLLSGLNGFGQDSAKVFWTNGNLKYLEFLSSESVKNPNGYDDKIYFNVSEFYNESGTKLTQEEFVSQFGSGLIDSLNTYKEVLNRAKELQHKVEKPEESNYIEIIIKADTYFSKKEFQKAYEYYKKALDIKPNEGYPKNKILELEVNKKTK